MKDEKNVCVAVAWPYANGTLHLGHASAFLGGDILARFYRACGYRVLMVSGSDCYGTPIAVEASQRGIEPSEIAEKYHAEFQKTLIEGLGMSYDLYTKTTTPQHQAVVQEVFMKLYNAGFLYPKKQNALYSPYLQRFLPDRFVEGTCPHCKADDARGDQCDNCGTLLDPLDLINPRINKKILAQSAMPTAEGLKLEQRESEHFYLKLTAIESRLAEWVAAASPAWRDNARTFALGFLKQGLHDRAVTRDTDWGVPIPLPGYDGKRIYVWFEAVLGYYSASRAWAEAQGTPEKWKDFWQSPGALHYYVHGKDNIPFHTIILPAILLAEGTLHLPDRIVSSEYLTLEGKQFSKSRGWAVWLPDVLAAFAPDMLRYYITVYGPESRDADFAWADFAEKVNGELIGTFGNLVNRTLSFVEKHFPNGVSLPTHLDAEAAALRERAEKAYASIAGHIEGTSFRAGFKEILDIAQHANQYIHQKEVWNAIKDESQRAEVEATLAVLCQCILNLGVLVHPFLPTTGARILSFFAERPSSMVWEAPTTTHFTVSGVAHLYQKITDEEVQVQLARLIPKE